MQNYPPPGSYPPPQQSYPQQPRRRPRKRFWVILAIALFLLIGTTNAVITHGQGYGSDATTPTPTVTQVAQVTTLHRPTPTPKPTPRPTPVPTRKPTPTPRPTIAPIAAQPPGVNGNPWGYTFTSAGGSLIYTPNAAFCNYFDCVSTFWTDARGYVVECVNGKYSHSGSVSGACSRDGGEQAALYQH